MGPRLVLFTVSTFHNRSVLFVIREVIRVIKETLVSERGSVQGRGVELVEIKKFKNIMS